MPRLIEARRVLSDQGSIFVHLDSRESHYVKIWLDEVFGRDSFMNEIIWAYDYGGRSKKKWPAKHDTIFWYAKDPQKYTFNIDSIDRIPYMAPGLVGPEKAERGKVPTDTWWHTIVPTAGKEKTGYPTQKPLGILNRIVAVHSAPGDVVLDFFCGSGTTGDASARNGRRFILVDNSPDAISVSLSRLEYASPKVIRLTAPEERALSPDVGRPDTVSKGATAQKTLPAPHSPLSNIGRTSVLAITVSAYKHLTPLRGPRVDARKIRQIFESDQRLALYKGTTTILEDPTADQFRQALISYVMGRGARGDILIFYFSGHGTITGGPGNEFGFCLADTQRRPSEDVLPLSSVSFHDVVRTLAMVDVHPVFIIDACFSAAIGGSMHDSLARHMGGSYAFLCSSHESSESLDFANGGAFTSAFFAACEAGRSDADGKRQQCLILSDLARSVQSQLEMSGHPLSRCHIGPDLPNVPISRNVKFEPKRYRFSAYFDELVRWLYNGGDPRAIRKSDIVTAVGNGAYGNHNKLSYEPWGLLEDGSEPQTRVLTKRGVKYAKRMITIPRDIEQDPITGSWQAVLETEYIRFPDE